MSVRDINNIIGHEEGDGQNRLKEKIQRAIEKAEIGLNVELSGEDGSARSHRRGLAEISKTLQRHVKFKYH